MYDNDFPVIERISDVLPYVEGRDEFVVARREFGHVVNYNVVYPDTFNVDAADPIPGLIRRECRGIIFDNDGNIMSRPFHKFFNLNEREETQVSNLDFGQVTGIDIKLDGSFIRPIFLGDKVLWGTKMGVTEVADMAAKFVADKVNYREFALEMYKNRLTPIFEYIGPHNRVVIDYEQENMVLLAIRDMQTGRYCTNQIEDMIAHYNMPRPDAFHFDSFDSMLQNIRNREDIEGVVVHFNDQHMVKLKAEHYVAIHKTKDMVNLEHNAMKLILDEKIDDLMPFLDKKDAEIVLGYEARFKAAIENAVDRVEALMLLVNTVYGADPKRVATELVPNILQKKDSKAIFNAMKGIPVRDTFLNGLTGALSSGPKYTEYMKYLEA